jgi:hypothetical protein
VVIAIPLLILGAEIAAPTIATIGTAVAYGVITGVVAYGGYKAVNYLNNQVYEENLFALLLNSLSSASEKKKPPYNGQELGDDPANPNVEDFEWRGKGEVGSRRGRWYNEETKESLHPDLDHPPPVKPHWDYKGPDFPEGARLNTDGTWEPK